MTSNRFFRSVYNKTIIRFGFSDIQNNEGLGKAYQPQPLADNPYLHLDYSGYHKNLIQYLLIIIFENLCGLALLFYCAVYTALKNLVWDFFQLFPVKTSISALIKLLLT